MGLAALVIRWARLLVLLALFLSAAIALPFAAAAPSPLQRYALPSASKRLFEVLGAEEPLVEQDVRQLVEQLR